MPVAIDSTRLRSLVYAITMCATWFRPDSRPVHPQRPRPRARDALDGLADVWHLRHDDGRARVLEDLPAVTMPSPEGRYWLATDLTMPRPCGIMAIHSYGRSIK